MNILVVEDQLEKCEDIVSFFSKRVGECLYVVQCHSLRAGLRELVGRNDLSLVVLDMSMPSFDPTEDDPVGGTPESFAGRELLSQMKLRSIQVPVVVVTQYATFSQGSITLSDLNEELASRVRQQTT